MDRTSDSGSEYDETISKGASKYLKWAFTRFISTLFFTPSA